VGTAHGAKTYRPWSGTQGERFDIETDYEAVAPRGTVRRYNLVVGTSSYNADGLPFDEAKLFNDQYPGPWLQACWGDTVEVIVSNRLVFNGTTVRPCTASVCHEAAENTSSDSVALRYFLDH